MTIENIKKKVILQNSTDLLSQNHAEVIFDVIDKINELIDALNTLEQDRSEQMARMVDRIHYIEYFLGLGKRYATQPKDEELIKNCPFCGSTKIEFYDFGVGCESWRATCEQCQTFCQNKKTKQEAINAWNSRHE